MPHNSKPIKKQKIRWISILLMAFLFILTVYLLKKPTITANAAQIADYKSLDVNLEVLPEYKKISPGGEILMQIKLSSQRGLGSVDANVKYSARNSKGKLVSSDKEQVSIEGQAKLLRKLAVPEGINPGDYTVLLQASSDNYKSVNSSDTFEVIPKSENSSISKLRYIIILIVFIIGFMIIFAWAVFGLIKLNNKKIAVKPKERPEIKKMPN